jgi:FMN hydrolase / 5-amino-6-(5-phospho-D-ribitylamino)uracil phosphatase
VTKKPALLLDVMGTLVRDPFFEEMPGFFGLTLEELIQQKHPRTWVEFEKGEIDEAECMRRFFLDERTFDAEAFKEHIAKGYAYLPGIEPLLRDLKAAGYEMHTLSNYTPWYRLIEERLKLSRYVPWTFVSCETRLRKPKPDAYTHAAKTLGRPTAECVFVDDRQVNVDGATSVGMKGIVFTDAESLRAILLA